MIPVELMQADALTPRDLFDLTVCYEIPPFQRPYVWTEEDQWQPLWDDIVKVTETLLELPDGSDLGELTGHFLGAVVLKSRDTPAGAVSRRDVIDGQQRLTTLQLLLDASQLVLEEHGDEEDAESLQELVLNNAKRFQNLSSRFKLWPSRVDRAAFEAVMDNELEVSADALASRIYQAHAFFCDAIRDWAEVRGDTEKAKARLSALAQVLQQHLQIVAISLAPNDDDQLIFETLNDRGTPLLAADLIKNFVFQQCEAIGADVDDWGERFWQDLDEDWWRSQVAQGRMYRSRIDLFLQYWLTMRLHDEIPSDAVFGRFRKFATEHLQTVATAEAFLGGLRSDADTYRDLVSQDSKTFASEFYSRVVETLELGTFIPVLLWLVSDNHRVPATEAEAALRAVESMAVRRTLLRRTMKDQNRLVVAILRELDCEPTTEVSRVVNDFLAEQTADSRTWPTDDELREELPSMRLYGNVKQPRLRVLLAAIETRLRTARHESVSLPDHLEIEHVMPRGWRTYWGNDIQGDHDRAIRRDVLVDTLGNLTLVTKKLNGSLSNRPWRDADAKVTAATGPEAGVGKRSLLSRYSILVLNKELVDPHPDEWTEADIRTRADVLTEAVISIWPRPEQSER
jgi:hypothetical protein